MGTCLAAPGGGRGREGSSASEVPAAFRPRRAEPQCAAWRALRTGGGVPSCLSGTPRLRPYLGVKQKLLDPAAAPVLLQVQVDGFVHFSLLVHHGGHVVVDPRNQNATRRVHEATCTTHTGSQAGRRHDRAEGLALGDPPGGQPASWPALVPPEEPLAAGHSLEVVGRSWSQADAACVRPNSMSSLAAQGWKPGAAGN